MRELEKHIARLLLNNDCVIVPGFGGFMAHNISAKYDEATCTFNPPIRIVGFNPQLTMNDSLLAQEYVNIYDISFPEALKQIATDVESLKRRIEEEGIYELLGIGKFVVGDGDTLEFQPEETGIVTPGLYGLDAIEVHPIAKTVEMKPVVVAEKPQHIVEEEAETSQQTISVRIPLNYIKHVAAACIALIIMLTMPAKLGDSSKAGADHSAINTSWFYEIMPKDITSGKPDKLSNIAEAEQPTAAETEVSVSADKQEIAKAATPVKTEVKMEHQPYYSIVIASRVTRANAEVYVAKLHKRGMKEASVHTNSNGVTKVIYKKFSTREEANKAKNQLTDDAEFEGSWITEVK